MPSDQGADDRNHSGKSTVAEETTRVEAVQYLEGVSGHGVFSLVLVVVALALLSLDRFGAAVVAGIIAFGIAGNGLSIYLWDELRRRCMARFETEETTPTRTLRPYRISAEMKAELVSGAVMVGGLSVFLMLALALVQRWGFRRSAVVAIVGLAVGNLCALGWVYLRS